ncbi:LysR family transcriptional regulator [Avibacterium avium]|uniref:LysR family transcriptional regulator n=1 Tax=Avibacterium avium TaxID=751 RepID=UPI003BF8B22C
MPLSPDVLKLIHTIAETGNFSIAAEKLYKVPSAISYTIKKVEDELGVILFDRSGRQVKLTEAGKYFICHSQWLLV